MPNNGWKPSACKDCKRKGSARCVISYRGLCSRCSERRMAEQYRQLREKSGPFYDDWLAGQARAIGALLQDAG